MNVETWLIQRNPPHTELKEEFFLDMSKKKKKSEGTAMLGLTGKERSKNNEEESKKRKEREVSEEKEEQPAKKTKESRGEGWRQYCFEMVLPSTQK